MPPRVFLFGITVCSSIFPPAGMGADLLESIFVPAAAAAAATEGAAAAASQAAASEEETAASASSSSQPRESYNVLLMEKLLRMLYASCQYGEQSRRLCAADGISRFSFKMRPRPPMLGGHATYLPRTVFGYKEMERVGVIARSVLPLHPDIPSLGAPKSRYPLVVTPGVGALLLFSRRKCRIG